MCSLVTYAELIQWMSLSIKTQQVTAILLFFLSQEINTSFFSHVMLSLIRNTENTKEECREVIVEKKEVIKVNREYSCLEVLSNFYRSINISFSF